MAIDDERVPRGDWRDTRLWRYVASLVVTRSSAVAKKPRDASCLYSFYTLKWCGYPMVKKFEHMYIRFDMIHEREKIAVFTYRSPHFCFPCRRPCDYHAICCMDRKTIQCLPNPSRYVPYLSSIVSELYDAEVIA